MYIYLQLLLVLNMSINLSWIFMVFYFFNLVFILSYKINVIYAILLHITKYESVLKTIFYMSFLFLHVQL